MIFSKFLHLFFILFILLPNFIYSQNDNVIISGFVREKTSGEVLIGTNILLYKDSINTKKDFLYGASTNAFGFYAIPKISKGIYYLVFRNIGFEIFIYPINILGTKKQIRVDVELDVKEIALEEVIINQKKSNKIKTSTFELTPNLITNLPSLSGEIDLFKNLATIAGVKTASELSTGLYVRGGSPDQTLTLVDGVIVYNPTHLGNFTSTFNSNAIQNIKLIKGAFPAEYGGRLSSVLDIKLRSGTKERDKKKIGLGLVNSYFFFEGPLKEKTTYMLSGRMMYYDFIKRNLSIGESLPQYNFQDINTKLTYNISASSILSISGMYTNDRLYSPKITDNFEYDINWNNTTLSLTWHKVTKQSTFLTNSISFVNYKFVSLLHDNSETGNSSDYFASSNLTDIILKSNSELNWNNENTLNIGSELTIHSYNLTYSDIYNADLESHPSEEKDILSTEAAVYLSNDWQISSRFNSNAGLRFYYFRNNKYFNVEPRFSFSYSINEFIKLNTAYSIAHQFLHLIVRNDIVLPTDLWYPSNSNIKPSQSAQYVLGLESNLLNHEYLITLESYYKDMKNLYEFKNNVKVTDNNSIENLFTKGEGEAYGFELFIQKRKGIFNGWIGYTLAWTKRKFENLNGGKIFYPKYDKRHEISLVLNYKISENFNISSTWQFASGQGYTMPLGQYEFKPVVFGNQNSTRYDYTARNSVRMPSYHKLDLNISYSFKWNNYPAKIYVNFLNLYNRQNAFAYYINPESNKNGNVKVNQITLFPFIPTVGFNIEL